MMKIFKLLIIIILLNNFIIYSEEITIVPLPFVNTGDNDIDYLGTLIQNSLFTFIKKVENYDVVSPEEFNQYLDQNNTYNRDKILKISKKLYIKYIIEGSYHEEDEYLIIDFKVTNTGNNKIIYRSSKFGKGGIFSFETLDILAATMIEDFTNTSISSGKIKIATDHPCTLYVDSINMGNTPSTRLLPSGMHIIKIIHKYNDKEKIIIEKVIEIKKDDIISLNVKVFVNFNIMSEKQSKIYINKELIGKTPYKGKLLTGQKYKLKITYNPAADKSNEIIITEQDILTTNQEDINLDFIITCKLDLKTSKDNLFIKINGETREIPNLIDNIDPGKYNIKSFIEDKYNNKSYLFFSKKIKLHSNETKTIDFDDIVYKKKMGLILLPSAAQFYNNQYIKAGLLLSSFLVSLASAAIVTPIVTVWYYNAVYIMKINTLKINGKSSGYTKDEIDADYYTTNYILVSMLSATIGIGLVIWLISLIDGAINMHKIDKLFNPSKKSRFKFSFDVRIK